MLSGFLALSSCGSSSNDSDNQNEEGNGNENVDGLNSSEYGPLNPKYISVSSNSDSVSVDKIGSTVYYTDEDENQGLLTSGSGTVKTEGEINVLDCSGEFETAYIEFEKISNAESYNIYLKKNDSFVKLDDKEAYVYDVNNYKRAEIFGLKKGNYDIKIVPVISGSESTGTASIVNVDVVSYDRSGYAHFGYTEGVGAYNDDGSLKDNAKVIYVTDNNKNTVTLTYGSKTVTGIGNILNTAGKKCGEVGHEDECKKVSSGKTYYAKGNDNQGILQDLANDNIPLVVRIVGCVSDSGLYKEGKFDASNESLITGLTSYDSNDYGGSVGDNGHMARMKSAKNVTIEGVGNDASLDGWGIHFMCESASADLGKSFEVRNITFMNTPEDALGMEGVQANGAITASVERCWIHHNSFLKPDIASPAESDKSEGDGSCDFKRGQYYTLSYNYFEYCHKTNLIGSSDDSLQFNITVHHNYWYNCGSRITLTRQANLHFYNNYNYDNITDPDAELSYITSLRANCYIYSEYNYYEGCKNVYQSKNGYAKCYKNEYVSCFGTLYGGGASEVQNREDVVTNGCKYGNIDYSKFDTSTTQFYYDSVNKKSDCYLTSCVVAKNEVIKFAGSKYRTVANKASSKTSQSSSLYTADNPIDLSSGTFEATLAKDKGSSNLNNIYYNNISGITSSSCKFKGQGVVFKLTDSASVTLELSGTGGLFAGQLIRSDGKVMLNGSGTTVLNPGVYYITSTAMDKETTLTKLSFKKYDSTSYNAKLIELANQYYNEIPANLDKTVECYNKIIKAINAYLSVNESNRGSLNNPYAKYNEFVLNYKTYTEGLINQIGTVNKESNDKINEARRAYNMLLVFDSSQSPSNYNVLVNAINQYAQYLVQNCIDSINKIGEVSLDKKSLIENAMVLYDILDDNQEAQITNYNILLEAINKYNGLYNVYNINNLIETANDLETYKTIINTYNDLNDEDKALITDISSIKTKYVIALIDKLPNEITKTDKALVNDVKNNYESLSSSEKEKITNYSKLSSAIATIESMKEPSTLVFTGSKDVVTGDVTFTVAKNSYKTDKGSYNYNGTSLDVCYKMDSKGIITFTLTEKTTVNIAARCKGSAGKIDIQKDGSTIKTQDTTSTPTLYTYELESGTYTIKRNSDENYIFLIEIL